MLGLVLGRPQLRLNLTGAALDLPPEAPPESGGGSHSFVPQHCVCTEKGTPASRNWKPDHQIFDRPQLDVMLLPYREGGGDSDSVPLLAVLHQGRHIDRRTDVWVDGAAQQLKRIPINWAKLDLTSLLVKGFVDTGVEDYLVKTHLAGHAAGHLTFALQQYGFNVIQDEFTLRRVWTRTERESE